MPPDTLAVAPIRAKHRPRFRRASVEERPEFRLTERDRGILKIIFDYRFSTADMLQDLAPSVELTDRQKEALAKLIAAKKASTPDLAAERPQRTKREILRRLQMLYHHGYVQRKKLADGEPIVYSLGNLGADELVLHYGIDRQNIDWTARNHESTDRYMRHGLMVSRFRHALALALREGPDTSLVFWKPGGEFKASVKYVDTVNTRGGARTQMVDGAVIPDGFFVLLKGGRHIGCFLEADRSTMSNSRYLAKLKSYYHYWNTVIRPYNKQHPSEKRHIRVLTITLSEERKKNLRDSAQQVSTEAKNLFWFACERSYRGTPKHVISDIWQTLQVETFKHL